MIVTLIAFLGTVPYIALQLKAVTLSFHGLTGSDPARPAFVQQHASLIVTILMAFFAILFGTKKPDVTDYQPESSLPSPLNPWSNWLLYWQQGYWRSSSFWWHTIVFRGVDRPSAVNGYLQHRYAGRGFCHPIGPLHGGCDLFAPAVFYNRCSKSESSASALGPLHFSLYLLTISVLIVPIAAAGIMLFTNSNFDADTYVLQLPLHFNSPAIALLVFIGGFSAATAMIIVATIALSTMVSNDVVLPMLINKRYKQRAHRQDFSGLLANVRRLSVILVLVCAYFYHLAFASFSALTSIGLLTFALVVQFAPGLIGGLFWKGGHANGFKAGLIVGVFFWFITLMLPALADAGMIDEASLTLGLFGFQWLQPETLLANDGSVDRLSQGVLVSLVSNTLVYVLVSIYSMPRLVDRIQASAFVNPVAPTGLSSPVNRTSPLRTTDLRVMLEQFSAPPGLTSCLRILLTNSRSPLMMRVLQTTA